MEDRTEARRTVTAPLPTLCHSIHVQGLRFQFPTSGAPGRSTKIDGFGAPSHESHTSMVFLRGSSLVAVDELGARDDSHRATSELRVLDSVHRSLRHLRDLLPAARANPHVGAASKLNTDWESHRFCVFSSHFCEDTFSL